MSKKTKERSIADAEQRDHAYVVLQHPGEEGFELLTEILSVVGDSLGRLLQAASSEEKEGVLDGHAVGTALTQLAVEIRKSGGPKLIKRILKYTTRDGKRFLPDGVGTDQMWTFNETFQGNYGEMFLAVGFVLEANYRNFFDGPLRKIQGLMATQMAAPLH